MSGEAWATRRTTDDGITFYASHCEVWLDISAGGWLKAGPFGCPFDTSTHSTSLRAGSTRAQAKKYGDRRQGLILRLHSGQLSCWASIVIDDLRFKSKRPPCYLSHNQVGPELISTFRETSSLIALIICSSIHFACSSASAVGNSKTSSS